NHRFALQRDGRIIVAGTLLERYNTDGSLDTTFKTEYLGMGAGPVIEPDDKILILRNTGIQRFNADGSLDFAFGTGGTATEIDPTGVAVEPDGKIIAVRTRGPYLQGVLRRYNPDGSLDTTFGVGGEAMLASYSDALVLQPDGKIVVGGAYVGGRLQRL